MRRWLPGGSKHRLQATKANEVWAIGCPATRHARRSETPNAAAADTRRDVCVPGLEVFPPKLLEHVDVHRLLTDELLQPLISRPQGSSAAWLRHSSSRSIGPAAIERRLRDLQLPQHLREIASFLEQPFALTDLPGPCSSVCLRRFMIVSSLPSHQRDMTNTHPDSMTSRGPPVTCNMMHAASLAVRS